MSHNIVGSYWQWGAWSQGLRFCEDIQGWAWDEHGHHKSAWARPSLSWPSLSWPLLFRDEGFGNERTITSILRNKPMTYGMWGSFPPLVPVVHPFGSHFLQELLPCRVFGPRWLLPSHPGLFLTPSSISVLWLQAQTLISDPEQFKSLSANRSNLLNPCLSRFREK